MLYIFLNGGIGLFNRGDKLKSVRRANDTTNDSTYLAFSLISDDSFALVFNWSNSVAPILPRYICRNFNSDSRNFIASSVVNTADAFIFARPKIDYTILLRRINMTMDSMFLCSRLHLQTEIAFYGELIHRNCFVAEFITVKSSITNTGLPPETRPRRSLAR